MRYYLSRNCWMVFTLLCVSLAGSMAAQTPIGWRPVNVQSRTPSAPDPLVAASDTFTFADSVFALGSPGAVMDKNGTTHVVWCETDTKNTIQIRYLQGSGGKFQGSTIDAAGRVSGSPESPEGDILQYQPAVSIDQNSRLHVAYYKTVNGDVQLWYASIDIPKGSYKKQLIDTGIGSWPSFRAGILSDSSGMVHIAYKKQGIWHAQVFGDSVRKTQVARNKTESPQQDHGVNLALLVDSNNTMLIPSHGVLTRGAVQLWLGEFINYGVKPDADPWQFKELYYAGHGTTQGKSMSGTYDPNGNPLIFYQSPNMQLGIAKWVNNAWQREIITLPFPTDAAFKVHGIGSKEGLLAAWVAQDGVVSLSTLNSTGWKHYGSVAWKAPFNDVPCPVISSDGVELWLRNADSTGVNRHTSFR